MGGRLHPESPAGINRNTHRVQFDGLQILWFLANRLRTHGIGESGSKTITGWLLMGAAGTNHIWWLDTNPRYWFTAALKVLSHHAPAFGSLKGLLILTAITPFSEKINYAWLAGCGRYQSNLVVECQPQLRFTAASKLTS